MGRHLFTLASAVSLLLAVLVAVVWYRTSMFGATWAIERWPQSHADLLSENGTFELRWYNPKSLTPELRLTVPSFAVLALLLFVVGFWVLLWLDRQRIGTAGACTCCGYDLRATPDRCPECGTRVAGVGT